MKILFHNVLADAYIGKFGDPFQRPGSGCTLLKTPPLSTRIGKLRNTLLQFKPDILLLNESCREFHKYLEPRYREIGFLPDRLKDGIHWSLPENKIPGMGILISSGSGFDIGETRIFSESHSLVIKINGINFIVQHNDPMAYDGADQLDNLMAAIKSEINHDEPVVLAGDFNACPYPKSKILELGELFEDPWKWSLNHMTYFPCYPNSSGKRYDYMLMRNLKYEFPHEPVCPSSLEGWRGMSHLLSKYGSDHLPLVIDIKQ
jgi:hypothetical protein